MVSLVFFWSHCLTSLCTHEEQRRVGVRLTGNLGAEVVVLGRRRLAVRYTAAVRHMDHSIFAEGTAVTSHIAAGDIAVVEDHMALHILLHIPGILHTPEAPHTREDHRTPEDHRTVAAGMGRTGRTLGVRRSRLRLAVADRFVGPLSWL